MCPTFTVLPLNLTKQDYKTVNWHMTLEYFYVVMGFKTCRKGIHGCIQLLKMKITCAFVNSFEVRYCLESFHSYLSYSQVTVEVWRC